MNLKIQKSGDGYIASWCQDNGELSRIDEPMSMEDLIKKLNQAGIHMITVYDEIDATFPEYLAKNAEVLKMRNKMREQFNEIIKNGAYPW